MTELYLLTILLILARNIQAQVSFGEGDTNTTDESEWGQWSPCSTTCGEGNRTRSRTVFEVLEGIFDEDYDRGESARSGRQARQAANENLLDRECGEPEEGQSFILCTETETQSCISEICVEGFPNSEFPGSDSETVCSRESCDPQISKLYKNSSLVESENLQLIEQIRKTIQESGNTWVAGKTSLSSISYSEVQAFKMGEIPASREDRRQTPERNRARQEFLRSLERKRRDRVNFPSPLSPVEVFTTDVNNQGSCSSCSVFAVTAALETCVAKVDPDPVFRSAPPRGLSSQNLLDCAAGTPGVFGCDGGQSFRYLRWLRDGNLDTSRDYPYIDSSVKFEGLNNDYRQCYQSRSRYSSVVHESHDSWDGHTERDLENILLDGHAIITTMDVQEDLMFYKSGVYHSDLCQEWRLGSGRDFQWEEGSGLRPLRHAVVIIGFGEEQGRKYWKVKNSWGENWGSSGFFKVSRTGSAHCGLGAYFSVALCKECKSLSDCKVKSQGASKPIERAPPNLPEEGISGGFTSHLATPLGGLGLSTCPSCANLSQCPRLVPCKTRTRFGPDKCCRVYGGSGNRLYCPSRC